MINPDRTIESVDCPEKVIAFEGSTCAPTEPTFIRIVLSSKALVPVDKQAWLINRESADAITSVECNAQGIDIKSYSTDDGAETILFEIIPNSLTWNQIWEIVAINA